MSNKMKLCKCGCGNTTKLNWAKTYYNRFIVGHNARGKTYSHKEETKLKISQRHKGRTVSEKQKKDISKKLKNALGR